MKTEDIEVLLYVILVGVCFMVGFAEASSVWIVLGNMHALMFVLWLKNQQLKTEIANLKNEVDKLKRDIGDDHS